MNKSVKKLKETTKKVFTVKSMKKVLYVSTFAIALSLCRSVTCFASNIGQNVLNVVTENAWPIVLVFTIFGAIACFSKRNTVMAVIVILTGMVLTGFVMNPTVIKDVGTTIVNKIVNGV